MWQIEEELWQESFSSLRSYVRYSKSEGESVAGATDKLLNGKYKLIPYLTPYIKIKFRTPKELGVII